MFTLCKLVLRSTYRALDGDTREGGSHGKCMFQRRQSKQQQCRGMGELAVVHTAMQADTAGNAALRRVSI